MKKVLKVISISLALVTACSAFAFAAGDGSSTVGGKTKTLKVKQKKGTVKTNGKATEKAWKKAGVIKSGAFTWGTDDDMMAAKTKKISGNVAKIGACKLLWDKKGIYIYIDVKDNTPYDDKFAGVTSVDSVEYHFDMANKKNNAYMGKNDVQYCFTRTGRLNGWGEMNTNGFRSSRNSKSINNKKKGYKQEIYVRCDWHGVTSFKKGMKVGFDLQINDALKKNTQVTRRHIVWNSIDNAWNNPATMGTLILS